MRFLVVGGAMFYVALCLFALRFVGVLSTIAIPISVLCGVLLAVVVFVGTLAGWARGRPTMATPNSVVRGTARLPKTTSDKTFGRDWAWPSYVASQWLLDFARVWKLVGHKMGVGWRVLNDFVVRLPRSLLWWPVFVLPYLMWLTVSAAAVLTTATLSLIAGIVLLLAWLGWISLAGALRALDLGIREVKQASGSCPKCYHVTVLPSYLCDGCGQVHRDLRPGCLGVVWRLCGCGTRLPTTVQRAGRRLSPVCPRCDHSLRAGAATVTDIRIPVFGPVSAGKTRLVSASLLALRDHAASSHEVEVEFVDMASQEVFDGGAEMITTGSDTVKTPAKRYPAISARIRAKRPALVHFFDAAGESYTDGERNAELEFLDHAQGVVIVVDPFSIAWVQDMLAEPNSGGRAENSRLSEAKQATEDPENVYHALSRRLRDYGIDTRRRALAVAVVKADLLAEESWASELFSGHIRDWLRAAGLDNVVLAAERDFAEVRYFAASSASTNPLDERFSPIAPFAWLIRRAGVELPLPREGTETATARAMV